MADEIYPTRELAQAEADRLNNARTRTKIGYVATAKRDWSAATPTVIGWTVGVCSDD